MIVPNIRCSYIVLNVCCRRRAIAVHPAYASRRHADLPRPANIVFVSVQVFAGGAGCAEKAVLSTWRSMIRRNQPTHPPEDVSMSSAQQLVLMAEDELTQYSTEARKIEKLRRKFGFAVPYPQQKTIRDQIEAEMPKNFVAKLVEENRQTVALPFWGIGGLGLLLGISGQQPLDLIATVIGFYIAFRIQKWGWTLEAKRLVIKTLDDIEAGVEAVRSETKT